MSDDPKPQDMQQAQTGMPAGAAGDSKPDAPASGPEDGGPPDEGLDAEALAAEAAELRDKLLRTLAELENVRRRAERDRADAARYGAAAFARDMLGVADNLRRALETVPETVPDAARGLIEGVEVTERALLAAFERHGITPISPAPGDRFDANLHEAMFEVPGTGQPGGTIVQTVETGYMIADRLLRAARVGVAKADNTAHGAGGQVDTKV